jgi:ketosteroid isomerase-like protein
MRNSFFVVLLIGLITVQCSREEPRKDYSKEGAEIKALIENYRTAWILLSPDSLKNCWERDFDGLIYVATERKEPFFMWSDIAQYFAKTVEDFGEIQWSFDNVKVKVLDDNHATVYLNSAFKGRLRSGYPISVENGRSTFVLRKSVDKWRIIQYHESSPLMQM